MLDTNIILLSNLKTLNKNSENLLSLFNHSDGAPGGSGWL